MNITILVFIKKVRIIQNNMLCFFYIHANSKMLWYTIKNLKKKLKSSRAKKCTNAD